MISNKQLYELFGFYEADRFHEIHNDFARGVVCVHRRPEIEFKELSSAIEPLRKDETYVRLEQYGVGGNIRGLAGKCEVCGKVYYTGGRKGRREISGV